MSGSLILLSSLPPFDGVTSSLQIHEGNVVKAPDDILLTINGIHPIYAAFAVEQFLPKSKTGNASPTRFTKPR